METVQAVALIVSAGLHMGVIPGSPPGGGVIVYGGGQGYVLTIPKGWVVEKMPSEQGEFPSFYPEGKTFQNAACVMYARAEEKQGGFSTAEDYVNAAVKDYQEMGSAKVRAEKVKEVKAPKGKTGVVYRITGIKGGSNEMLAYFNEPKVMNFIVMSCQSITECDKNLSKFYDLVESYLGDFVVNSSSDNQNLGRDHPPGNVKTSGQPPITPATDQSSGKQEIPAK